MHQAGWLLLLSLVVWSRCDEPMVMSLASPAFPIEGAPYDRWVMANGRGGGGGERGDDGDSESTIEAPSSDDGDADDDGDDGDGGDPFDDSDDIDQSASTASVQSVGNQSELNASLAQLLRNHNLESLKRNYDPSQPLDRQKLMVADLLKSITGGNGSGALTEGTAAVATPKSGKSYDISDLKKYYDHIKMDELNQQQQQQKESASIQPEQQTAGEADSSSHYQHANHNYYAKNDWRPVISTADSQHRPSSFSYYQQQFSGHEVPSALANFYVDTDTHLLHAHETQQNKDLKEVTTTTASTASASASKSDQGSTSSNLAGTTVKDLISTKDPVLKEKEKIASLLHKQHTGYVPVENSAGGGSLAGDKTYQEYVNCCDQLFKNYGNKEHIHEDIYLVPKGGELELQGPPHHGFRPMMPPGPYLRGFPGLDPDMKLISGNGGGKGGGGGGDFPPGGHVPVQCIEDQHHSGHLVPAAYHGGRHHPRPFYHHHHHPPAAFLLKKKLALIGKKYLLGMGKK